MWHDAHTIATAQSNIKRVFFMSSPVRVQSYYKNCTYANIYQIFCWAEFYSAIIDSLKTMRIAHIPFGVPAPCLRVLEHPFSKTCPREGICYHAARRLSIISGARGAGKKSDKWRMFSRTRTYLRREPTPQGKGRAESTAFFWNMQIFGQKKQRAVPMNYPL